MLYKIDYVELSHAIAALNLLSISFKYNKVINHDKANPFIVLTLQLDNDNLSYEDKILLELYGSLTE